MRGTLRDQFRGKHPFFWVVVVAAVYAAFAITYHAILFYQYAGMNKDGFVWEFKESKLLVGEVFPNSPAEGKLQTGDLIIALNGEPATLNALVENYRKPLGTQYTLEIERNGVRQQIALRLELNSTPYSFLTRLSEFTGFLMGIGFLCIAIFVGLLRSTDPIVRLLFVAYYLAGLSTTISRYRSFMGETGQQIASFQGMLTNAFIVGAIVFHLFLRFPPGIAASFFWRMLKWTLYGIGIITQVYFMLEEWGKASRTSWFAALLQPVPVFVGIAIISVIVRNYRLVKEPQQKQRIRWVVSSTAIALGMLLLSMLFYMILSSRIRERFGDIAVFRISVILAIIGNLIFILSTGAWAYAILKHRVLDINVVIRRSLRYLLASRGFILIEALLAFALLSFVFAGRLGAALDRFGSNTRTLITILGTVLMVLGLQTVNRQIRPLIDRRFFRDAYDAQQILTELTSSLRATTNVNEVLELTTAKIQQALYAANVTIFLRNGQHDFSSAVSSDYHEREKLSQPVVRELHLPDAAFVVQRMHASSQPAEIDWDDPYSPVATQLAAMANGDAAAQQEFDTLRALQTNLVLPLTAKDELLGVLALGPRAGDLPYSREDKRMLMNVAGQTAMALENSRLIEQKIELEAQNEQRAKELEEACQLQLSMLPKKVPQLSGLEIAAYMKTATEVGGDYYDFHVAEDGTLTIAVGDATGHGLRAGMMVTATKSLFNELVREPDLPELMRRFSRALKAMNLRGLFMALTIVRINGNRLTISSAGMPAALLYRAAEQRVEELLFKSMPLGSITNYVYKQQEATIEAGDMLVLLSDGLPERFDANGEMLGDEAAVRVLCEAASLLPSEIIQRLVQLGDEWGGAHPQDDDATFVVVRRN